MCTEGFLVCNFVQIHVLLKCCIEAMMRRYIFSTILTAMEKFSLL